jgi:hypothetical protein
MTSAQDRKKFVTLIDEAVASGARQFKACAELGLHARTFQRWKSPDGKFGKIGARPRNVLRLPIGSRKRSEM